MHKVFIFEAATGSLVATISISHPIDIYVSDDDSTSVFVGFRNSYAKHDNNHTKVKRSLQGDDADADPNPNLSTLKAESDTNTGGVWRIDSATKVKRTKYTLLNMKHPTGIASYGEVLYVADQSTQSIFSFNITTAQFIRTIASKDDILAGLGDLEHIIFSDC